MEFSVWAHAASNLYQVAAASWLFVRGAPTDHIVFKKRELYIIRQHIRSGIYFCYETECVGEGLDICPRDLYTSVKQVISGKGHHSSVNSHCLNGMLFGPTANNAKGFFWVK